MRIYMPTYSGLSADPRGTEIEPQQRPPTDHESTMPSVTHTPTASQMQRRTPGVSTDIGDAIHPASAMRVSKPLRPRGGRRLGIPVAIVSMLMATAAWLRTRHPHAR